MGEHVGVMAARTGGHRAQAAAAPRARQALVGSTPLDEARSPPRSRCGAEKSDITEELARLRAHMGELARLLDEAARWGAR
jgi:uncharacterized protein YicC (UPF0701 family)